jgi:transcriptional regulator with XRE-family HTH domain
MRTGRGPSGQAVAASLPASFPGTAKPQQRQNISSLFVFVRGYTAGVRAPPSGEQRPAAPASFGSELRRLRLRAGLTREVLAERAGVSLATLSVLEAGQRRRPYPSTVVALAEALGLASEDRARLLELASGAAAEPVDREPALIPPPASATTRAGPRVRLPMPPTPLIGREADVAVATACWTRLARRCAC